MSDNIFRDSNNKSKSVIKDEVGKNDIYIYLTIYLTIG